jgi:hypothetical protein
MAIPFHIIIEGNSAIVYASRNGAPEKVRRLLQPFLAKFWQEREAAGEYHNTPECLAAQIIVRLGFEICEDDYSNLRIGTNVYDSDVEYLYAIALDQSVTVWVPQEEYRQNPSLGLAACRQLEAEGWKSE